jgi:hypothetical protein
MFHIGEVQGLNIGQETHYADWISNIFIGISGAIHQNEPPPLSTSPVIRYLTPSFRVYN